MCATKIDYSTWISTLKQGTGKICSSMILWDSNDSSDKCVNNKLCSDTSGYDRVEEKIIYLWGLLAFDINYVTKSFSSLSRDQNVSTTSQININLRCHYSVSRWTSRLKIKVDSTSNWNLYVMVGSQNSINITSFEEVKSGNSYTFDFTTASNDVNGIIALIPITIGQNVNMTAKYTVTLVDGTYSEESRSSNKDSSLINIGVNEIAIILLSALSAFLIIYIFIQWIINCRKRKNSNITSGSENDNINREALYIANIVHQTSENNNTENKTGDKSPTECIVNNYIDNEFRSDVRQSEECRSSLEIDSEAKE